jgi:Tol biopolymer transport system component
MKRACSAVVLAVLAGGSMLADQSGARDVRLVAAQRVHADAIDTLKPAALSEDGRLIAFVSRHRESSHRSCCQNVYVLDRSTGLITQESISTDGAPPDGDSQAPSLSADGQVTAFETIASNLQSRQTRVAQRHVVVRNRLNGALRSPQGAYGKQSNGDTGEPVVSADGLVLVFTSDASNLVPEPDANGGQTDVFLWHLDDSTISRVSVDSSGQQRPIGASHSPSVSRDGALVAFVSTARLAPEDANNVTDVYLRDVRRGITSLISRGAGGRPADGPSHSPVLSPDGRYVAFASGADNLAPGDHNQENDVYLYEPGAGAMTLVSATSRGTAANATSGRPAISADGRYVAYQSMASNLGSGAGCPHPVSDTNLLPDVYLFDRMTRCVTRISGSPGREWWTPSVAPAIDGAGTLVVFSSTQPIDENDPSTDFDLFLFLRASSETPTVSDRGSRASRCSR